ILAGKEHEALALDASAGRRDGTFDLACCLARLAAQGLPIQLSLWDEDAPEESAPRPGFVVPICGANYVKPAPERAKKPPIDPGITDEGARAAVLPQAVAPLPSLEPDRRIQPTMTDSIAARESDPPMIPAGQSGALAQALQISRESLVAL